jgi:hypothetical protein
VRKKSSAFTFREDFKEKEIDGQFSCLLSTVIATQFNRRNIYHYTFNKVDFILQFGIVRTPTSDSFVSSRVSWLF